MISVSDYVDYGKQILAVLTDHGYLAYFVGGYVRDFLLGIIPGDIDITTDATPDIVRSLFVKTRNTGERFGTVTVYLGNYGYEVTTFRNDGKYLDNRHPESVQFAKTLREDLSRRDFTINALAQSIKGDITDLYGGKTDLQKRLIRSIGTPKARFEEDALRILRAFRFVAKLDFTIEPKTFETIKTSHGLIANIANERVIAELKTMMSYPHYLSALHLMHEAGLGDTLKELKRVLTLLATREDCSLRFEELLALASYLNGAELGADWRLSNKEKQTISRIAALMQVTENDSFNELLLYVNGFQVCLSAALLNQIVRPDNNQEALVRKIDASLPIRKTCDLSFKGDDILALTSVRNAEVIGDLIDALTNEVIMKRLPNEYDALKAFAIEFLQNQNH